MKKFFQKYAILFFFCAMMGGIIMIDSILAISFTDKERGLATEFSDYTKKISILQADSSESFSQEDLMFFLQGKEKINVIRSSDYNGIELYSNELEYFKNKDEANWTPGVWLRRDVYENWIDKEEQYYYYKGKYFNVLGTYEEKKLEEKYIVDMQGVLNNDPQTAVKGVYYLDCEQDTNTVFEELQTLILQKNPYAQITVLEESSQGYILRRIFHSQDAMYYIIQMGVLLILNLFNFGNIAGYWVKGRTTEIFVRKMVGAADINIFKKLIIDFSIATGMFIFAGMLIGAIIIGVYIKIVGEIALFGVINCTIQWLILILFGGIFIWKQVRKTMTQLRKQN